jgi:hypothetical protein
LFESLEQVYQHYLSTDRLGGPHVLQQYVDRPHLLQGHKYSLRMFVVISNYCGSYLYPQGYFNIARQSYQPNDLSMLGAHLTNEHLPLQGESAHHQIPTSQCPSFEGIYEKIVSAVKQVLAALKRQAPELFFSLEAHAAFSLFGFDFMLDEQLRLWLLEVNHGPCFPKSEHHPLQDYLYRDFWQKITGCFVMPILRDDQKIFVPEQEFLRML